VASQPGPGLLSHLIYGASPFDLAVAQRGDLTLIAIQFTLATQPGLGKNFLPTDICHKIIDYFPFSVCH